MNDSVSIKARARVQWGRRGLLVAAITFAGVMGGAAATMPDGRPTPTGLDVPRWISLKSSKVRARAGPGLDHRILWEYRAAGLPVQVIAETREWRKVCDPEGNVAWIHLTVARGSRNVFNSGVTEIPVRTRPSDDAPVRARFSPRSLLSLEKCREGWCEVRARRLKGWVRQDAVFGAQTLSLCDAGRPAGPPPSRRN